MPENNAAAFRELRVFFEKSGRAVYISHLDLMRTMTRAVRRADIPIWYTEGFNRHPYLTFAAPLSLGYEGLEESMDIRITDNEITDQALANRLAAVMPDGLSVLRAAPPVMKPGEITAAVYRIVFTYGSWIPEFLAQESVVVSKKTKKGKLKEIDLLPYLKDTSAENTGEGCALTVTLPAGSTLSVNPSLVIEACRAFTEDAGTPVRVTRISVLGTDGKSFE